MIFYVRGRGAFPYDMLRYDGCYPVGPDDAAAIAPTMHWDDRTIKMCSPQGITTPARWASFGWSYNAENIWGD